MKMVKSLVLGSLAAVAGMSGAQAADLPVKAKPVEYVRICSLYGAGFFYIPGTDTCLKIGGYLRVETAVNGGVFGSYYSGINATNGKYVNYWNARSREDLNIDTRTATEYGVVRTFFDATFSWTSGGYTGSPNGVVGGTLYDSAPAGTNGNGSVAGGALGVYYAFIQFAGFTIGKAISQFSTPWTNYPANNFDGLVGGGGDVTGVIQFTYTFDFGGGSTVSLSAQDQVAYYQAGIANVSLPVGPTSAVSILQGGYGVVNNGGSRVPDFVAMYRLDQAWGLFQASFASHDNHAGYYGVSEITGHPDDKWGWAAQLALSIKNIPTGAGDTVNLQGVYTDGATRYNLQDLAAIGYVMFSGTSLLGAYQSVGFANALDTVYTGTSSANGSNQESVKTWGFRGGYTHNWDPYWNTGIYGAYAHIGYGPGGTAQICNNFFAFLTPTPGSTCNPNFNIAQAGIITRWTPVKNLTFSADFTYTRLDQAFSGAVTLPASGLLNPVAKPTGAGVFYELKDQNSFNLLIRAQRNW